MKQFLSIVFLIACQFFAMAQEKTLEWGELEARSGQLIDVMPFHSQDFYTLRWKGGSVFGGYYLSRFDDLKETKSNRISIAVNYNIANFEQVLIVDDHPVVILTNIRDGKEQIFLQPYGYDLEPRGEAILLAEYILIKGMSKSPIKVIQSKDKKYFAVLWLLVGKKKDQDVYGYAVYDNKFKKVDEGEYEVPFESRYSQITDHLLSNTGHYFFLVKEYTRNETKSYGQPDLIYKAMHIFQVSNDDGLDQYTMDVKGKRIEAISINTDDSSKFTITGVYGSNEFKGVQGVFFMDLDFRNQKVIREGFQEFGKNFITEDWSEKEIERAEKRESKGKDEPALYNYQMREAQLLSDGTMVGIMEQNYVVVRSFSDTRSMITFSYTYYYNDIIVFKIGKGGTFEWIEKVRKSQISSNDGGPYSSFASIIDGDKIRLIFNDNIDNYDQRGAYIANSVYSSRFNLKHNTVAMTEIDLVSGLQNRYTVFGRKDTKTIAVPKKFTVDLNTKEMLLFTSYKGRELYGIMKFK
jgi:hypothetical protein